MNNLSISPDPAQGISDEGIPGGSAWERSDRAALQLVANLFPAPTLGQAFVVRFVERADAERSTIPDLKAGDVVICTSGIAQLAKELNLAYDTTQKYVALFKALEMLQKRTFMGRIAFILSLGIYLPPKNLEANLNYLLQRSQTKKSRTKYHDLVASVKQRCQVYGLIDLEFTESLRQLHELVRPPEAGTRKRTLEQRLAEAQHLVSSMLARAMTKRQPGREDALLPPNLPDTATSIEAERQRHTESPQTKRSGRFAESSASPNLSKPAVQIDSVKHGSSLESTQPGSLGGFSESSVVSNLTEPTVRVDSSESGSNLESTQPGSLGRFPTPKGPQNLPTQATRVDSSGLANVNVLSIITSNINVNVQAVATLMCRLFGEPTSKQGIYAKLFREYHQAEAIHAAIIYTLVHFHRDGTIENPAAVFIARCKAYHTTGIPEEAAELLAEYGSLPYQRLLDALQKPTAPASPSPRHGNARPVGAAHSGTPPSLPPLPQWGTIPRLVPAESTRGGMSRQEALEVVARAKHHRHTKLCRVDLERLADGSYAVLLDNTITAVPRQTYFYSLRDWEARTATIEECFELFGSVRSGQRCLADALKARRTTR